MKEPSRIYLSKSAIKNNIEFIRKVLGKKTKISSVVKGNAYGHGIKQIVPIIEDCGINHFSVFSFDEAIKVKKSARKDPKIMIMGFIDDSQIKEAIKKDIEFFVFEFDRLEATIKSARHLKKPAKIHIEVETGLNRTGFSRFELDSLINLIKKNRKSLKIEGLCTHYAGAESIGNYYRIKKQIKEFNQIYKYLIENGIKPKIRHTACSAAALSYPQTKMDMVRIGILQYGGWPSDETFIHYIGKKKDKRNPLKPVLSWKSEIMNTKRIKTGEYIGYGDYFLTHENMRIATVPVGYCQGYSRALGNHSRVIIKGKRVNVIGIVNMNIIIVNVSQIPHASKGDEVILIGGSGKNSVSFSSFCKKGKELNYEVLSRLPESIPRIVIK